jgi:voltage-gated potassium channel
VRLKLRAVLERYEILLDIVMALLACAYIVIGEFNDGLFGYRASALSIGVELAITAIFVVEYASRLYAAHDRMRFVRTHILELLSLISTLRLLRGLQFLRILRFLRIARLATLSHAFARLMRAMRSLDNAVSEPLFAYGIIGIVGLIFFGSLGLYGFEKGTNPAIHSFGDAFWLAVSIVLTVGVTSTKPITDEGRAISGLLIVGGLTCVSFFSSAMVVRFQRRDQNDVVARLERIEELLLRRDDPR